MGLDIVAFTGTENASVGAYSNVDGVGGSGTFGVLGSKDAGDFFAPAVLRVGKVGNLDMTILLSSAIEFSGDVGDHLDHGVVCDVDFGQGVDDMGIRPCAGNSFEGEPATRGVGIAWEVETDEG